MSRAPSIVSRVVLGLLLLFAAVLTFELIFNRDHYFVGIDYRT